MRLIITEKNNSASKIADILSGGSAVADAAYKVPFYTWADADGDQMTIGLKGHVMSPEFPATRTTTSNWQKTNLHDLIDAELIKEPTDKNVVKAVRKVAKEADSIVIATDYDREGELIGLEALEQVLDANPKVVSEGEAAAADDPLASRPPIKRARYSALTKEEIERAFAELDELSYELAYAGATRQDIDLIWGATLTRAVSLATRRFGSNFLSVGRVQSPTLALIVERELERRAHVAEALLGGLRALQASRRVVRGPPRDGQVLGEGRGRRGAWRAPRARGSSRRSASKRNSRKPPTPFNTTAFTTDASSRLGITPSRAMRIAEDLYMDGFISYPRTDNTVYPRSLTPASWFHRWSELEISLPRRRFWRAS